MQATAPHRPPLAVSLALLLTRILTWGVEPGLRRELIIESAVDWEDMYRDYGSWRVIGRALRGIPTAILERMEDHDMTAIPAALVFTIMAAAATGAGLLAHTYPANLRRPTLLGAIGLGLGGIALIRNPRRIVLRHLRLPALALGFGSLGIALNMPTVADWQYDTPMIDTPFADVLLVVGFSAVAAGCLLIILASFVPQRRVLAAIGGITALAGIFSFGIGQIIWGFAIAPVDLAVTVTSISVGLGACSLAHVLPRIRYLEIV